MSKITLNSISDITQSTTAQSTINNNNNTVQTAFDNTLSRDGTAPNQMAATLDMNSNQIINLPVPSTVNSPARLIDVTTNPSIVIPGTGTSGHVVPYLDGNNTWSGTNTLNGGTTFNGSATFDGTVTFSSPLPASSIPYTAPWTSTVATNVAVELSQQPFLNPYDFGAKGDGTTNDTAALQACINAAITNSKPVYLPHGQFLISSALNITSTNKPFSMYGNGLQADCNIVMATATQNGLYFNSSSRITLQGFGIRPNGGVTSTAGSCIYFDGTVNTGNEGFIDNVDLNGWIGINGSSGWQAFTISNCNVAARANCIVINTPGDSTICACRLSPLLSSSTGITITGNGGGIRISNNKCNGNGSYCVAVTQSSTPDGDVLIENNSFEGATNGIIITTVSSTVLGSVMIIGNEIGTISDCIQVPSTSANWLYNMVIQGNICQTGTANTGITIESANYFTITGNIITEGTSPGSGRLTLGTATVQGLVVGNIVSSAGTIADTGTGNVKANNLLSS